MKFSIILLNIFIVFFVGCTTTAPLKTTKETTKKITKKLPHKKVQKRFIKLEKKHFSLRVTATAYTSRRQETDSTPTIGAWNNRLSPKRKSIAVSRDLLKMGLGNGTRVRIKGLRGIYTVRDKMNKRWRKKIDIYMGMNLKKARRWGKRRITIYWDKKILKIN